MEIKKLIVFALLAFVFTACAEKRVYVSRL